MTFSCTRTAAYSPKDSQPVIADTAESHKKQPCHIQKQLGLDLNDKAGNERIIWMRCGPSEVRNTPSGDIDYPEDTVTLSTDAGNKIIYSNSEYLEAEGMEALESLHLGPKGIQVLLVWVSYGTGNIHGWKVLDLYKGKLREWSIPDIYSAFSKALEHGEKPGKEVGPGPQVDRDGIVETCLVYRAGDDYCCSTGGVIRARLSGENGILHIMKVWREAEE